MKAMERLGYSVRPATLEDVKCAVALFNICSKETLGVTRTDENDVRTEWKTPNFNLDTDTRVVFDGERLVGYAEFWSVEEPHVSLRFWGRVHPDYRGQGIGTALLKWAEARAHQALVSAPEGAQVTLCQGVHEQDVEARALLTTHGYEPVRHFYRMQIDFNGPIPAPAWPRGISVRAFDARVGLAPVVRAVRDAFQDHWGYVETPFDQELKLWQQWVADDEKFDPGLWFLASEGDEIVGTSLCKENDTENQELGSVDVLGVRRPWRRRGLALALLRHSFLALCERGQKGACLGVDATSLTGANRIYERAGMRPVRRSDTFERILRPGVDLRRQTL